MRNRLMLMLFCTLATACAPEPAQTCLPLVVKGKLIVGSDMVLPSGGIFFEESNASIGAP